MASTRRKSYVITLEDDDDTPGSVLGHHHGPRPEAHVKFGSSGEADKQAPALIRKLKKHMDILIENFEKISKEHLLCKEDLYRALKEENDMLGRLEKFEDQLYDNLFNNGEMSKKYGSCGSTKKSGSPFFHKFEGNLEKLGAAEANQLTVHDKETLVKNVHTEIKGMLKDSEILGDMANKTLLKYDYLEGQIKFYETVNAKLLSRNQKLKADLAEVISLRKNEGD